MGKKSVDHSRWQRKAWIIRDGKQRRGSFEMANKRQQLGPRTKTDQDNFRKGAVRGQRGGVVLTEKKTNSGDTQQVSANDPFSWLFPPENSSILSLFLRCLFVC